MKKPIRKLEGIALTSYLVLVAGGAMAQNDYGWSLSGSSSDAHQNTGPILAATPFNVYLWLTCANQPPPADGIVAAEFSLATDFFNAGFTPVSGVLNAGNSTDLLLAIAGCPGPEFLVGSWTFLDFGGAGGTACMVPSPGGLNVSVDCDPSASQVHDNAITGYTTDGSAPCMTGDCEGWMHCPVFICVQGMCEEINCCGIDCPEDECVPQETCDIVAVEQGTWGKAKSAYR